MKILAQTMGIMALAVSLSYGQDAPEKPERKHPDLGKMFKKLDADGNAAISLDEFKASPRAQKNPAKAEEVFKKMDSDSSEGISLKEFKAHRPAPKHRKKGGAAGE